MPLELNDPPDQSSEDENDQDDEGARPEVDAPRLPRVQFMNIGKTIRVCHWLTLPVPKKGALRD